jgi:hypothetical protein
MEKITPTIGTIIHATHRPQDLIPAFLHEYKRLDGGWYDKFIRRIAKDDRELAHILNGCTTSLRLTNIDDDHSFWESDLCADILEDLFDCLDVMAPSYAYFGAHPGDGSDFGYWPSFDQIDDSIHDGELLKVDDLSDVPGWYNGEVCIVNDHGNMTVGWSHHGEFKAYWDAV